MNPENAIPHYIYIMKTKDAVKVGVSGNPEKRKRMLQFNCPYNIVLLLSIKFSQRGQAFEEEKRIKFEYGSFRIRGEWYEPEVVDLILESQDPGRQLKWYTENELWMEPQWREGIKEYDVDFSLTGTARIRVKAKTSKEALARATWLCDKRHIVADQWEIDKPLEVVETSLEEAE